MTEFVGGNRPDRNTKQDTIPDFQKIANDIQSAMQAAIAEVEKLAAEAGADREQAADIRSQDTALRHEIMNRENRQVEDFFAKNAKGEWVNYNLECVKAGYTPYFVKYGRARRFHKEFVEAQDQARATS